MSLRRKLSALLVCLLWFGLVGAWADERPAEWAKAVPDTQLQNFWQVSPHVYRSAQPYKEDFQELEQRGIGAVLDLRLYHRDVPDADTGLLLHQAPLYASDIDEAVVISALQFIANAQEPVLVHCWQGSDRTGLVVAMYRVVCQGWSKDAAIDEMQQGKFGYHAVFGNIPEFIRSADAAAIREQVRGSACP
jgi:protein-tyrosine phosphatase